MTTHDPKYKHKPSEKHTLEEVLKSLQDLIRHDLPGGKSTDSGERYRELPPAGPGTSIESAQARPGVGEHGAQEQDRHKPHREHFAPIREDFAPTASTAGPVNLDAVMRSLKDLISNELNVGGELAPAAAETAPSPPDNRETEESVAPELAPPDEAPTFEDPDNISLGDELAPPEESVAFLERRVTGEDAPEEFIALDEELTFEGSAEITYPLPAALSMPELPGEISPELLSEPEEATPPPAPKPAKEEKISSGMQQELPFNEAPSLIIEHESWARNFTSRQETALESASPREDFYPDVSTEPTAESADTPGEDTLPTIEVEETFDESAYYDAATRQADAQQREAKEVREIIASAMESPLEPEITPPTAPPAAGERRATSQNPAAASTAEPPSAVKEIKPDIAGESAPETMLTMPSVDFDAIGLEPLPNELNPSPLTPDAPPAAADTPVTTDYSQHSPSAEPHATSLAPPPEERPRSSAAPETPAPSSEPPPATAESPAVPEAMPETPATKAEPGSAEINAETMTVPEQPPAANGHATPRRARGESADTIPAAPSEPGATEKPSFNLDDIPVLLEVVAPPAGSTLISQPAPTAAPPLPAPDRARDIAVRAVAKLNVEMRKSGGAGLDTKTILRLQQLIRKELEKGGEKSQP